MKTDTNINSYDVTNILGNSMTEEEQLLIAKSQYVVAINNLKSKELLPEEAGKKQPWRAPKLEDKANTNEAKKKLKRSLKLSELFPEMATKTDKKKAKKPLYSRPLFWVGLVFLGVGGGAIAYGGMTWYSLEQSLPEMSDISAFNRDGTLTIKAADDTIIFQQGPATREQLTQEEIPDLLKQAFVAIEDRRFHEHKGVDYPGIARAIASNVLEGDVVQGGSTITQQLARMVFLNQEQSIRRKLREAMLAWKIEEVLTKEQILERYLNLVYLGSGAYGVADASRVYFSKPVQGLTLPEIATLAGLAPAPSEYSPLENPEAAKTRRNLVLQQMAAAGYISEETATVAIAKPLEVEPSPPKRLKVIAPYFATYIKKELSRYLPQKLIDAGGLTVETTLALEWQKVAERVVGEAVDIDGYRQGFDQAALVSLDPRTGAVKALVGGRDYTNSEFNRATQAQRQPGSTFKGLVYAAAIAAGFSPTDGYPDVPFTVDGYKPKNYGNRYASWRSMENALTNSTNVVAVQVLMEVGFEPVMKLAKDMGIKSEIKETYSLALGAWEVNLLELTNAYGTLANQGKFVEAHGIKRVINAQGEVVYEANFEPKRVLDEKSAAITSWMLERVVERGTGGMAYLSDRPVAGKTGTSEEARDLWFIGYIPQVVTGVWLGNDNNDPTWGASSTAAFNWREFMKEVVKEMPVEEFPELPDFYDREPSIEAKPVEYRWVRYGEVGPDGREYNASGR
jgi:penicillin-binding protein 1A